jgi:putative transposase
VVSKGIAAHGVPQRLLSDNGAALNPSRRGVLGQLVAYVTSLGVEPITGKPYKPTTQGKNERFHQTLFRWLDKQPLAESLEELQEQVDRFDRIYNTERPHQGLPGRVTPAQAWEATSKAEAPRPAARNALLLPDGVRLTRIRDNGTVFARGTRFHVNRTLFGDVVSLVENDLSLQVFDESGTLLIEHPWPEPGTKYVGSGRPKGPRRPRPTDEVLPMS